MSSFIQKLEQTNIFEDYQAHEGSVAHPNGYIYGIPDDDTDTFRMVEYDPATNTARLVGDNLENYDNVLQWKGGTLGSDGCVYGAPFDADRILKYDPATETTTLVGDLSINQVGDPLAGYYKYESAISAPETDSIYFIPSRAKQILRYHISDGTTSYIGDNFDVDCWSKWKGACRSKVDGCIYFAPSSHRRVLKFNPVDGSTTLIGEEYDGSFKWTGCVETPDGTIYCTPCNASNFLKIDVRMGRTSLIGKVQQPEYGHGWDGCVAGIINGNMYIYVVPRNADKMLIFQTNNESVHEVEVKIHGRYSLPAISSFDGNAYAINNSILKIVLPLLQTLHQAIQVEGIPWALLQSIAESNIKALEEGDPQTALLPFMSAAEKCNDDNELGSLASLTIVYELLSMKPAVLNHYVTDGRQSTESSKGCVTVKRRRLL